MITLRLLPPARRDARGFTLLEVLVAAGILSVALLGIIATTLGENRFVREETVRSGVLDVVQRFTEKLRADDDWVGLYDRLRGLEASVATLGEKDALLQDGRRSYPPTAYFSDFVLPRELDTMTVLVSVPSAADKDTGVQVLREDINSGRFDLPADLNGDGTVDDAAHNGDYSVLPLHVTFRWVASGEYPQEMRMGLWLRGER